MANASLKKSKWVPIAGPKSPAAEAYKTLRTNIQFLSAKRKMKSIMVTSSLPNEGKTTTIANLAIAYAQENKRVLLVDCDFRKPSLHHFFSANNRLGFSDVLSSGWGLDEAIQPTKIANLSLLPSGTIPPNPTELLNSGTMSAMMRQLEEQFDLVLLDAPPALVIADAHIVASHCDGIAIVVNSRKTNRELVKKAVERLRIGETTILGVILNYQKNALDAAYRDYY